MTESDIIWAALLLAGLAYEIRTLVSAHEGDTLSETTRSVFRTRTTRIGRIAFLTLWAVFAGWFTGHILDWWA